MTDYIHFPSGFTLHRSVPILSYEPYAFSQGSKRHVGVRFTAAGHEVQAIDDITLADFEALAFGTPPSRPWYACHWSGGLFGHYVREA